MSRLTWGTHRLGRPFRLRDCHPVSSAFPCRFDYKHPIPTVAPQPQPNFLGWFGLFPVRSPLLRESLLFSFPSGTEMFHFPEFAPSRLCIQRGVRRHYPPWVSPFGHSRIVAWLAAPRDLSQPPTSFIASDCQGILRVPFVAWSLPPLFVLADSDTEWKPSLSFAFRFSLHFSMSVERPHQPQRDPLIFLRLFGGADRNRTDDIQLAKLALYQLSYGPVSFFFGERWWAWKDLNFRPHAYQACALTS